MANLTVEFFSNCLLRPVQFKMYIPNDMNERWQPEQKRKGLPMHTVVLLHGYTGAAANWIPERLAVKYNLAVVMPNGENGFWVDGISTGHRYGTFLTEELTGYVRKTFGLCRSAEDTSIMGMSMGGYGALRAALDRPDVFGRAVALSPALVIHSRAHMKPGDPDPHGNYEYYRECFGDLETVEQSRNNPEVLVDGLIAAGRSLPEIFLAIGTEDFLLQRSRDLHAFLDAKSVKHHYIEFEGGHDMEFWDECVRRIVPMLFGDEPGVLSDQQCSGAARQRADKNG